METVTDNPSKPLSRSAAQKRYDALTRRIKELEAENAGLQSIRCGLVSDTAEVCQWRELAEKQDALLQKYRLALATARGINHG